MEVESQAAAAAETEPKMASSEDTDAADKSPVKEDKAPEVKKNGTLAGIAAAAASNAASVAAAKKEERERASMSGIILQFPEIFSMKRDGHILEKFQDACDIRMQKYAFIECESEEAAVELQNKLNNSTMNNKRVLSSRLDLTEKNTLYTASLKSETTDEFIKATYPGVEEILREKFNTFIRFSSETECRAARTKIIKEGINGQKLHCDFDLKKDRFKQPEEPPAKKAKEDDESREDGGEDAKDDSKMEAEDSIKADDEAKDDADDTDDVKADEW